MRAIKSLLLLLTIILLAGAAAAWFDEPIDAGMDALRQKRPGASDETNLFLALLGAPYATDKPLHVAGRKVLELPPGDAKAGTSLKGTQESLYKRLAADCRAIPAPLAMDCTSLQLPLDKRQANDVALARNYRNLRNYTAFASELGPNGSIPLPNISTPQLAFIASQLTTDGSSIIPVDELLADTMFLRAALEKSDTLATRLVLALNLERNYRLVAEAIEASPPAQVAPLKPLLEALPTRATNLLYVLPFEYATFRQAAERQRMALLNGEDPFDKAIFGGKQSPIPEDIWQRRFKGLWLKPNASANVYLDHALRSLGTAPRPAQNVRELASRLNLTGDEIFRALNSMGDWPAFASRLADLDRYVKLVGLVGRLAQQGQTIDPAGIVNDWNRQLPGNDNPHRLRWDEPTFAFVFDPASEPWKKRAKTAKHGVKVRIPPQLVPEVDSWNGYTAQCAAGKCELIRPEHPALPARPGVRLADEATPNAPVIDAVSERHIDIRSMDKNPGGEVVERRMRLRIKV